MSSTEEDGFVRYHVHLAAEDVIPAYLAVPTGDGPFPAVVIFHQHAGQRHLGKSVRFDEIIRWMTKAASAPA
jgi:dienelactone hydrolase